MQCVACQDENPETNKFCGACGALLAHRARQAVSPVPQIRGFAVNAVTSLTNFRLRVLLLIYPVTTWPRPCFRWVSVSRWPGWRIRRGST